MDKDKTYVKMVGLLTGKRNRVRGIANQKLKILKSMAVNAGDYDIMLKLVNRIEQLERLIHNLNYYCPDTVEELFNTGRFLDTVEEIEKF